MALLSTERLTIRKVDSSIDAAYVNRLLNSPKFLKYIGDRGVRSVEEATVFIDERYGQSFRDHGYGMYAVVLKETGEQIGMCGFVRRDYLPGPDLGFAFLPEFEGSGYGFESASAMLEFGRSELGFTTIRAITSLDNVASGKLLEKLGFRFQKMIESNGESLKLYLADTCESDHASNS